MSQAKFFLKSIGSKKYFSAPVSQQKRSAVPLVVYQKLIGFVHIEL